MAEGPAARPPCRSERRTAALVTIGGYLLAYVVVQAGTVKDRLHPALPALATALAVVVVGLFERSRARSGGSKRAASLTIRRGTESVCLMIPYVGGLAISVAALGLGYETSGPDGVSGSRHWGATMVTTAPYPGRSYTWATLAALGLLAAATWWALQRVDARPAQVEDPRLDRALRLGSRIRVLRWSALGSLLTAGGLCLTIGPQLNQLTQKLRSATVGGGLRPPTSPWDWTQNFSIALTLVGCGILFVALVVVLVPAPLVPRSRSSAVTAHA